MGLAEAGLLAFADADDAQLWKALQQVAAKATESGVGLLAGSYLRSTAAAEYVDVDIVRRMVDHLGESLEGSPIPNREIPELARVLGWPMLARLTGGSEVSLRRYATDRREAPDDIARRIHMLALMVADLRGGYNDFGVRRWIERPRKQLGGSAPIDILVGHWSPEAPDVQGVRDLAAWVSLPTAAS